MARSTVRAALVLAAGAAWMSCSSSSTAPKKAGFAGVWHVTTGALTRGTISPTSFDVTVTAAADTFVVSMPTVTWSVGPVNLNGQMWFNASTDSLHFGILKSSLDQCGFLYVNGTVNAARDALSGVMVEVGDSLDIQSQTCQVQATGSGTANK